MTRKMRSFLKDCRGASAVMFGLALPMLVLAVGGGMDVSRAVAYRQKVASAIELSCAQSVLQVNYLAAQPGAKSSTNYRPTVDAITDAKLASVGMSSGVTDTSTVTSSTITIVANGSSANSFAGVIGMSTIPVKVTRACSRNVSAATGGSVLFMESFETNHSVAANNWDVLGRLGGVWNGWTSLNAGIEINGQPELASGSIRFGNFFAELDSDCLGVSPCNSNSTMSREVTLAPGDYELRYWYISRVLNNPAYAGLIACGPTTASVAATNWNGQTNRIEVYIEKTGNYTFAPANMVDVCVYADQWTERKIAFHATSAGVYRVSWRAAGLQDTLGGLIDYLRLCTNTCP